jgi:hypothetical protein
LLVPSQLKYGATVAKQRILVNLESMAKKSGLSPKKFIRGDMTGNCK